MINLSALKENIDSEIEASKRESPDVFRCGMVLAEIVSEALEQVLESKDTNTLYCIIEGRWVITENGCVITCPKCRERLELCYPDGTEVRYLPHCPWCGKKLEEKK